MTFCLPNNSIDSLKFGRILQRSRVEIFSSSKVDKMQRLLTVAVTIGFHWKLTKMAENLDPYEGFNHHITH